MTRASPLFVELLVSFSLFTFTFLGLLLYVLWWKRRYSREHASENIPSDPYKSPSKELLYYLSWKSHSQTNIAGVSETLPAGNNDAEKMQELSNPSKGLHSTVMEESEKAGVSETLPPGDNDAEKMQELSNPSKGLHSTVMEESEKKMVPEKASGILETDSLFFTPSSSPPFYTPASSPVHPAQLGASHGGYLQVGDAAV